MRTLLHPEYAMRTLLKQFSSDFISLIYPDLCDICDENQAVKGRDICIRCLGELRETDYNLIHDNPFIRHFYGRVPVLHGACLYHFSRTGTVRKLLHAIKYKSRKEIGIQSGRQLGSFLNVSEQWQGVDYLVPVPLHPKKKKIRGYNQCQLLAEGVKERFHRPIAPVIKRAKFSISQTKKGRAGRVEALNGVFTPDYDYISLFNEKNKPARPHFLIIDDVLTTGATLEACSIALLQAFPEGKLSLATLAMGRMD